MTDSSGDQRWYIRIRGRVLGPFDLAQLQLLKSRGQFTRLHEVSTDRRNWQPAAVLEKHSEPPPADDTPEDSPESSPQPAAAPVVQDQPLEWYYAQGQTQMGPVSLNKLQELMDYGQITKKDLAWSEGLPEWQPICKIPALQSICESASGRQPTTKHWRRRLRTQRVLGVLAVLVAVCLLALVGSIWFGQDAKPVPQSGTASADGADSSEAANEQARLPGLISRRTPRSPTCPMNRLPERMLPRTLPPNRNARHERPVSNRRHPRPGPRFLYPPAPPVPPTCAARWTRRQIRPARVSFPTCTMKCASDGRSGWWSALCIWWPAAARKSSFPPAAAPVLSYLPRDTP